jgi:ornithine carbamoyltransferase
MTQALSHYLQFKDLSAQDYAYLFSRAAFIKHKFKTYDKHQPLTDRTLAMIFEKASTRTRISFEAGMYQMGGAVVHLTTGDSQLGRAEPIEDSAKVISRMVDLVMIRTYEPRSNASQPIRACQLSTDSPTSFTLARSWLTCSPSSNTVAMRRNPCNASKAKWWLG